MSEIYATERIQMQIKHIETLQAKGKFAKSQEFKKIQSDICAAISKVDWPDGSGRFCIFPRRKGNGVTPIKKNLIVHLVGEGWIGEERMTIASRNQPGKLDVLFDTTFGAYAVEWETGNVASSHRALNKMAVGLLTKKLIGGTLILPTRKLYQYLTDRIGNWEEIAPYVALWKSLMIDEGVLEIIAVEHDEISDAVPLIKKGTDGRALR